MQVKLENPLPELSMTPMAHREINKLIPGEEAKAEGKTKPKQKANSEAPWRKRNESRSKKPTAKRLGVKKDWPRRRGVSGGMDGRC